jgi:hypothetical protein
MWINKIKKHFYLIIALILSTVPIIYSMRYIDLIWFYQDPWIALYGAKRILEGQLLYKDFFDFVTPGTDYLLAGVFYLFGIKLTIANMAVIISNVSAIIMVAFISFDIIKNKWLAFLPPVFTAIYSSYYYYVSHHYFVLVPVILMLLSGINNIKDYDSKVHKWFFTGLATAGAFLFIQSIGLTLFGMIVLFIVWHYTVDKLKIKPFLQPLMYYILGFIIPLIFVVICFALSGSLSAFIYDSFIWPFSHYKIANASTVPELFSILIDGLTNRGISPTIINGFIGYFGILLGIIVFVYLGLKYKRKKTSEMAFLFFTSALCVGLILGLIQNPESSHIMVFLPVYILVIILIFEFKPFWSTYFFKIGYYVYFLLITVAIFYNAYKFYSIYNNALKEPLIIKTLVGNVRIPKAFINTGMYAPYGFLKEMSGKLPKYIFVLYWSPSIYMLTGTENPTMLNTYLPYYNTKEQAMAAIRALKANRTKLVVIDEGMNYIKLSFLHHNSVFDPRMVSPDEPLISYIHTHYRLEKTIPGYTIYRLVK